MISVVPWWNRTRAPCLRMRAPGSRVIRASIRRVALEPGNVGQGVAPREVADIDAGQVQRDPLACVRDRPGLPVHLHSPHLGGPPARHEHELGVDPDSSGYQRSGHHGTEPAHAERPIDRQTRRAVVGPRGCDLGHLCQRGAQGRRSRRRCVPTPGRPERSRGTSPPRDRASPAAPAPASRRRRGRPWSTPPPRPRRPAGGRCRSAPASAASPTRRRR